MSAASTQVLLSPPGEDPLVDDQNEHDINSVAGVLKLYFRGLENPLFPKERFQDFISTMSKSPERGVVTVVREREREGRREGTLRLAGKHSTLLAKAGEEGGAAHGSNQDWKVHQERKCDSPKPIQRASLSLQQVAGIKLVWVSLI